MATFAILVWPVIALLLFRAMAAVPAIIWGILVPYLFLPEKFAFNLPGLPDLDKTNVIALGVILGFVSNRDKFRRELTHNPVVLSNNKLRRVGQLCLFMLLAGSLVTVHTNGDVLRYGQTVLPPMRLWDVISMIGTTLLYLLPFFFARTYLVRPETHQQLLSALVVMGLVYSLFMLIEIRLSPQLHNWIYGYHQHSFLQHIRDGFRPKVFLFHGLWVGFFMFMCTIAAFSMWRARQEPKWLFAGGWIFIILALSANLAALLIAILGLVIIFAVGQRAQLLIAIVLACTILLYPMLRQAQLIPIQQIMNAAANISEDRAMSLLFRLENEDQLLQKALERPVAGWGGYSRERVYDSGGRDISVSEGRWIQTISTRGWLGYIGLFGLLTIPLLFLLKTRQRKPIPPETLALIVIILGNLIYMIPNSTLTAISFLVFGAMAGFTQYDSIQSDDIPAREVRQKRPQKTRYTRFGQDVIKKHG